MSRKFFVTRAISGSYCVIYKGQGTYIDAQKKGDDKTSIEIVYNGQVRTRVVVLNEYAPATLIDLMRML